MKRRDFLTGASLITVGELVASALPGRAAVKPTVNMAFSVNKEVNCKSLTIRLTAAKSPVLDRVVEILGSRIQERSGVKAAFTGKADCSVELVIQEGIGKEGFRIEETSPGAVRILGNDNRGLLYGVGKFLRGNTYHEGSFTLGSWRGTSVPETPMRGVLPITHFFNFYHVAPIEEIQRYVEDLALWGFNLFVFGFDIHKFESIHDPAAQAMLQRIILIGEAAKKLGLDVGLGNAVNDAYANSPEAMRADWTAGHDGYTLELAAHYHVELCPNKPGAKELLLKWREETFQALKGLGVDYMIPWPYDNGGCTNTQCKPWGANGFLTMAEPIAAMARRDFPGCKVILSTWAFELFTSGEFDALEEKFGKERPQWIDYVLVDEYHGVERYSGNPPAHRSPGGLPVVGFPDVSMWGAYPWGGFGANPVPAHHQKIWNTEKDLMTGGFLYSEGIYEDLNKVLYAQFYWQKDRTADSIVEEYIAYEFSPAVVAPVRRAIDILETNLPRWAEGLGKGAPRFVFDPRCALSYCEPPVPRTTRIAASWRDSTGEALNLMRQADKQLSTRARSSWRWRILYLRALIDDELVNNEFRVSPRCEQAAQELTKIYYAQKAVLAVSPVTKENIERHRHVVGQDM